jgi:DNA-binding IclR family transcriptional regulator
MTQANNWALLSHHGLVLLMVAEHPNATIREVADTVGVTERTAARILADLRDAGFLLVQKEGRRNSYEVVPDALLRKQIGDRPMHVGDLLRGLVGLPEPVKRARPRRN